MIKYLLPFLFLAQLAYGQGYLTNLNVTNLGVSGGSTFTGLSATTVPYLNSSKALTSSAVTPTQLGFLSTVSATSPTSAQVLSWNASTSLWTPATPSGGSGSGTVTSVGMTVPSILSVTPSSITTSGTFALTLPNESQNYIFAGPSSGGSGTPLFRSMVSGDLPTIPLSSLATIGSYSVLGNNTGSSATPAAIQSLVIGTPSISDTGVAMQATGSVAGYYQSILQNTSNNAAASADFVVNNNLGTASTYYGDFGINSSTFTGSGSLNLPNASYLYSSNGDLALGTYTSNAIHLLAQGLLVAPLSLQDAFKHKKPMI